MLLKRALTTQKRTGPVRQAPDDQSIFRTNKDAKEDIDVVDTSWGKVGTGRSITPEEAE